MRPRRGSRTRLSGGCVGCGPRGEAADRPRRIRLLRGRSRQRAGWEAHALSAAGRGGDSTLVAGALAVLALAEASEGPIADARAHCTRAATLVDEMSDEALGGVFLDPLVYLCRAEYQLERFAEAEAHRARWSRRCRNSSHRHRHSRRSGQYPHPRSHPASIRTVASRTTLQRDPPDLRGHERRKLAIEDGGGARSRTPTNLSRVEAEAVRQGASVPQERFNCRATRCLAARRSRRAPRAGWGRLPRARGSRGRNERAPGYRGRGHLPPRRRRWRSRAGVRP